MQLRQVILLILGFISSTAFASGSRPIEVLSDAYGAGVPTQYTVLRDNSRLTFSHPYFGQFTRAEIRTSDKSGITTTRFILSGDGKSYRPVMLNEEPHMIHNMAKDDGATCEDTSLIATTAYEITNIEAAAKFDAAVKKKTKELKAAKFFDASCFAKKMSKEDQDTLFTGVAQVLVREQSTRPTNGPRYLTCLNEYGFANESGQIEALVKQSLTHKLSDKKRLYVACTTDSDAYPGSYNTVSNSIILKWRATANPPSIAATFLEESLHAVGLE
ncbi:MAG: hypothetical protein IPJ84_15620 [Bdellovibrionales bacterium]|nr:hypothetical protein [Bdellovibrionales bacterium]